MTLSSGWSTDDQIEFERHLREPVSPEWARALGNVLACVLSYRTKALVKGANPSECYSEAALRQLIVGSLKEAVVGFTKHANAHCPHIRCREEAIVVAVATKEAKLTGRRIEEVELESLARLYEWMDGRN